MPKDSPLKDMKMHKILCVGEILWDMLPDGAKAGGAPMNVALHLKKFGLEVNFAGRIGDDQLGKKLEDFLRNHGMNTSLLQVDPEMPTSTVEVYLQPDHQVRFEIIDNVAWDRIEKTDELGKASEEAGTIIYGTLASRHQFTYNTIIELLSNNCLKLIDVNLRPPFNKRDVVEELLKKADIIKLNDDELRVISSWYNKTGDEKKLLKWFSKKYNSPIVCVTRGARGAMIQYDNQVYEHPGYAVDVVDTVGSGDAFLAGFLYYYLHGKPILKSLEFACATGALVASKSGGTPDYNLKEIHDIMKR